MHLRPVRYMFLAAIILSSVVVVRIGLLGLRWGHAEAQSVKSAPACQSSAPTSIPSVSTNVAHCVCGGMSCAVSENTGQGKSSSMMQCVK